MQIVTLVLIACVYFVSDCHATAKLGRTHCKPVSLTVNATGTEIYPASYPDNPDRILNTQCKWMLKAETPGNVLVFEIVDAKLPKSPKCKKVRLVIIDGRTFKNRIKRRPTRLCGTELPKRILSTTEYMVVVFSVSKRKGGFVANVYEIPKENSASYQTVLN